MSSERVRRTSCIVCSELASVLCVVSLPVLYSVYVWCVISLPVHCVPVHWQAHYTLYSTRFTLKRVLCGASALQEWWCLVCGVVCGVVCEHWQRLIWYASCLHVSTMICGASCMYVSTLIWDHLVSGTILYLTCAIPVSTGND